MRRSVGLGVEFKSIWFKEDGHQEVEKRRTGGTEYLQFIITVHRRVEGAWFYLYLYLDKAGWRTARSGTSISMSISISMEPPGPSQISITL